MSCLSSIQLKVYSSIRSQSQHLKVRHNMMCLSIMNFILEVEKLIAHRFQFRTRFELLRLVGPMAMIRQKS
jgi:hypothetical protein